MWEGEGKLFILGEPTLYFFSSFDIKSSGDGNLCISVVAKDDKSTNYTEFKNRLNIKTKIVK